MKIRRVVTLPPAADGLAFARRARDEGADLLEVRSDLHAAADLAPLRAILPLLVSERGRPLPADWAAHATLVDRPRPAPATLISLHADAPLSPADALDGWSRASIPEGSQVKHVEPLGPVPEAERLFETQRRLIDRFGKGRVTVLATGPLALPFRCLLARWNALDYLALDAEWAAAPGQRLLADAAREGPEVPTGPRRGILGARIGHSRSPRTHAPPFDRIDLPEDAPLGELLDALHAHYRGFAITTPFKKAAAEHAQAPFPAVNTLVRRARGWDAFNTDVEGAGRVLGRLGAGAVTILGDGGAAAALRIAAANDRRNVTVLRRSQAPAEVTGLAVWTWPAVIEPPPGLRFTGARVAVIAYGAPGREVAERIRGLGGVAVRLGAAWFVAQARGQRRLWERAT